MEISGLSNIQAIQTELIYSMLNIKIAKIEDKMYKVWNKEFLYTLDRTKDRDLAQNYYSTVSTAVQTILPIALFIFGIGYMQNVVLIRRNNVLLFNNKYNLHLFSFYNNNYELFSAIRTVLRKS